MYGMHVNMDILLKLRIDLEEMAEDLEAQLCQTDHSIDEAAITWNDEKFLEFKSRFEEDKNLLHPLSASIREFNDGFLNDTIVRLEDYLK